MPRSDELWGRQMFKNHELLSVTFTSFLSCSPSLLSFLPPPLFLLTPLTRVESYQTKWHLRDWLGSFSQLCLEMVECLSCLVGSCWQLLPPIGLWAGFANMMSWFLEEVTHMINFLKVHHRCARPSLCLFFLSVFDNFHVSLLFISTKKNVE